MTDYKALIKDKAYINGEWRVAHSGKVFSILNPATGAKIAEIPDMDATDTNDAVAAAKAALPAWRARTAADRAQLLKNWDMLIRKNLDALALLLTTEQGKPLAEAKGEITAGANSIDWFAAEARRIYGDTIPSHKADVRVLVLKQPVGVVGAITPWNFPNAMITRKVAPALAAGCTVILKPAEDAPLSALALAELAAQAGIPAGVLNIVTGSRDSAAAIGEVLSTHKDIAKFSFTGSTAVGKILMKQTADTVKRVSMELGGNAPFIVFDSADIDKAVDGAIISKFRNAGQTCVCANRLYVQDTIYDMFVAKLATKVKAFKVGNGAEDGVTLGPLINDRAVAKVQDHVKDALAQGAKLACGGNIHKAGPLFFEPTILTEMTPQMALKSEETFGPVAGIFRFTTEAEVVREANDTIFGLAAYCYTNNLGQAFRMSEALEYGMVALNEPMVTNEAYPFGGIKESGMGRENSKYGLDEYLEIKSVIIGGL